MPFIRVIPEEVLEMSQKALLYEHRDGGEFTIYFLADNGRILHEASCAKPELNDFYVLCHKHKVEFWQYRW